jgi:hypothetical protein
MKKLDGLKEPVKLIPQTGEDISQLKIPTLRDVMSQTVATVRGISGEKSVRLMKVGLALMSTDDTLEMEDADFELLKEVVGLPGPYTSFIMGQALAKIQEVELRSLKN